MKFWKLPDLMASFEHARLQTAYYSKSFYISAKMLPTEKRWATYALYGFCRYADNLIDNPRNRTHQELLNEVRALETEINSAYNSGESEHPILKSFIFVAKRYGIPKEYPMDLLKGVVMDIDKKRYQTFEELYLFCYRVAGVVGLMMTHVLGYKSEKAFYYAEKLGTAMQLTNILRDIQEDKNIGRIYLPIEELNKFGLSEHDIINENMPKKMHDLMKFQIKRASQYYEDGNKGISLLSRDAQFAIFSSSKIYNGILLKIEAQNYNPFLGRVYVSQVKKFGILFQEIIKTKMIYPITRMGLNYKISATTLLSDRGIR
ncbi:MAG: phytoene/squalene synthase family protein [Calditrichaeota bacterium]|nr:MAG: phytoene/squalene synthase family protein [Calditrichota bacterium]MBL1207815.1 phytoene/squalene synthase family protein [Calditrichota bacterium]NOG47649.1 phytoene/squalene synthase family protein [Calditrichota bacterium]